MDNNKTRFTSVDEYIATFPKETQKILEEVRATIKAAAPGAVEKISYQMPAFSLHGNLVYFAGFKNHIGFFPGTFVTVLKEFSQEISSYVEGKGTLRFPLNKPMPHALITKIVKFRVAENLKKAAIKSNKKKRT